MTNNTYYDVIAVGNAIVDTLSQASDEFLTEQGLTKGMMTLIDEATSHRLFNASGPTTQQSGGSAANTMAGIASFGGRCAYIGKVADDEAGRVFRHDMLAQGIDFHTDADTQHGLPTARCMIFVSPDAERTMATHLGVSTEICAADLDEGKIQSAQVTYLEGYLFDKPKAKEAFQRAATIAHAADKMVALTLSDPFCVGRHREDFMNLIDGNIDILFANEQELLSLYETDDFNAAIRRAAESVSICAVTQGAKGATVMYHGAKFEIPVTPVERVVDTTGAGDLFAAGFLYGFTQDMDPYQCGLLGTMAAAEIISHMGARPEKQLKTLLAA